MNAADFTFPLDFDFDFELDLAFLGASDDPEALGWLGITLKVKEYACRRIFGGANKQQHRLPHPLAFRQFTMASTSVVGALQRLPTAATAAIQRLPTRARLLEVEKLHCDIFQTSFNPTSVRTGAKYLRGRLRGPSMVDYYPPVLSIPRLNNIIARDAKLFKELDPAGLEPVYFADEAEEQRLADVASLKARGKGKPKKARTAGVYFLVCCGYTGYLALTGVLRPLRGVEESEEEEWWQEEVDCIVVPLLWRSAPTFHNSASTAYMYLSLLFPLYYIRYTATLDCAVNKRSSCLTCKSVTCVSVNPE